MAALGRLDLPHLGRHYGTGPPHLLLHGHLQASEPLLISSRCISHACHDLLKHSDSAGSWSCGRLPGSGRSAADMSCSFPGPAAPTGSIVFATYRLLQLLHHPLSIQAARICISLSTASPSSPHPREQWLGAARTREHLWTGAVVLTGSSGCCRISCRGAGRCTPAHWCHRRRRRFRMPGCFSPIPLLPAGLRCCPERRLHQK